MAAEWFCKLGGKELGPISSHQLKAMADVGRVLPETPVRRGAAGPWFQAGQVKGLFSGSEAPPPTPRPAAPKAKPAGLRMSHPPVPPPAPSGSHPPAPLPVPASQVPPPAPIPVPVAQGPEPPAFDPFNIPTDIDMPSSRSIGRSGTHSRSPAKDPEKQKQLLVVVGLVAGAIMVAAVAVILWISSHSGDKDKKTDKLAAKTAKTEKGKKGEEEAEGGESGSEKSKDKAKKDAKTESSESDEDKWVDAAKSSYRREGLRVRIRSATRGWPPFTAAPPQIKPADEYMTISIEIENTGLTKKLEYSGWGGPELKGRGLKMTDKHGNKYTFYLFEPGLLEGQADATSIRPGKSVKDVLVFEAPIATATYARLELPAAAISDQKDPICFEIPMTMITASKASAPPTAAKKSATKTRPAATGDEPPTAGPSDPAAPKPAANDEAAKPAPEERRFPPTDDEKAAAARELMGIEEKPAVKEDKEEPAPGAGEKVPPKKKGGRSPRGRKDPQGFNAVKQQPSEL